MSPKRSSNQPNPRDYDMYAAFRTRERGAPQPPPGQSGSRVYDVYARRAAEEQNARREARRQEVERARVEREQYERRKAASQNAYRQRAQAAPEDTHRSAALTTRVQSSGANPYGNHSSYRTSDGRILDGFDERGRPIYRDSGASAVIRRTDLPPEAVQNLRPVRRVRIETLADTESKPFPFLTVGMVLLCTLSVMAVLFAFMRLNEYTNALSAKTYQLSTLRNEANALQAEVVRREDLLSIEQIASEILGMVKVDVLTKKYVTIENEDKTEIVAKPEQEGEQRVSVEIDLDTGKPMSEQDRGNAYIPPSETAATQNTAPAPKADGSTADSGT